MQRGSCRRRGQDGEDEGAVLLETKSWARYETHQYIIWEVVFIRRIREMESLGGVKLKVLLFKILSQDMQQSEGRQVAINTGLTRPSAALWT